MGFLLIRFLLYPTRYYVMRVLCLLILLPLLSMSQNNQSDIIYWVEGGINNGFSYNYSPPVSQWTPYTNTHPIGIHTQSIYGFHFSLGWNKSVNKKLNINIGIENEITSNKTYMDVDSVVNYYDTTGILYYHNNINKYNSVQIPVTLTYSFSTFYTTVGLSIPIYIRYHAIHNNILGLTTYTAHDWFWNLKFPSVLFKLRLGWSFLPKWSVYTEYSKYSNNSFLSSGIFSTGIKYQFSISSDE